MPINCCKKGNVKVRQLKTYLNYHKTGGGGGGGVGMGGGGGLNYNAD